MSLEKFSKLVASCLVTCLCFEGAFFNLAVFAKDAEVEEKLEDKENVELQEMEIETAKNEEEDSARERAVEVAKKDSPTEDKNVDEAEGETTGKESFQEQVTTEQEAIDVGEPQFRLAEPEAEQSGFQDEQNITGNVTNLKQADSISPSSATQSVFDSQIETGDSLGGDNSKAEESISPSSGLIINEVMLGQENFSNNEFIELFNNTKETIDLEAWKLTKKTKSGNESNLLSSSKFKGEIGPGEYFVIKHPDFKDLAVYDTVYSGRSYSIAKDNSIVLYDSEGDMIDMLCWGARNYECGGSSFSDNPENGFSLARKDPVDKIFSVTSKITPGEENVFPEKEVYSKLLSLNEIVSNPDGVDKSNEWVEIISQDVARVDLSGWLIKNGSGRIFIISQGVIESFGLIVIKIENAGVFSIRNSNEQLSLLNPNGEEISRVFIPGSARSGLSYNNKNGDWSWSRHLTPGKNNSFNNLPNIGFKKPNKVYKDMYVEFDASKTKDIDGEQLKFKWDFGDGHRSYLKKTRHKYDKKGIYKVVLEVDDGTEKVSKETKIEVRSYPKYKLEVVRIMPNPQGKDAGNEIISIRNYYKKKVNLKGYKLATGKSKNHLVNHPVYEDFIINSGREKELLSGDICKFSLLNKSGAVALLYPDGKVADFVKYEKTKILDNEEYVLLDEKNNHWTWIGADPPSADVSVDFNELNNIDVNLVLGAKNETSHFVSATKNETEMICECTKKMMIENWKHKNKKMFIATSFFSGRDFFGIWKEGEI